MHVVLPYGWHVPALVLSALEIWTHLPYQHFEQAGIIFSILQIRKLRCKVAKQLNQCLITEE